MNDPDALSRGAVRRIVLCVRRARDLYDSDQVSEALSELAAAFPALAGAAGICPFDANGLHRWLNDAARSAIERDCAAFVLHVFDRRADWGVPFEVMEVMQRWDEGARSAFVEWAHRPWWA